MSDSETNTAPPQNTRNARNRRKPRTVSSLTAQQIRHKRDLDRKAQRALRQRAKSRTQDLENDLALAKSCSSDRERRMMDEIQSLRHEIRRLGSCLESIAEFALGGTSVEENVQGADDSRSPGSGPIADNEHPVRKSVCLCVFGRCDANADLGHYCRYNAAGHSWQPAGACSSL